MSIDLKIIQSKLSKILTLLNDNELSVISMRYSLRGHDPRTLEEADIEIHN
jgi:DNA-directed RNA polymerase sigma subunit (sigma70/sigma32)